MPDDNGWRSRIVRHARRSPKGLMANPKNWRSHPPEQRAAMIAVLDDVGWVQDVVVNERTGMLIDGHLRTELAVERGERTIPIVYVDLSPEEEATVLATLDPLAAMATVNTERLESLLRELTPSDDAIRSLLDNLASSADIELHPPPEGLTDPDDVPDVPAEPYVQRGEIYALGDHRIMCGDATETDDVARLMEKHSAVMMVTDPPYAIYGSSTGVDSDVADDKMVRPFFLEILRLAATHIPMFGHIYICCDWRSWPSWWEMGKRAGVSPKNLIVWDKDGPGLGHNYANAYEMVGFFTRLPPATTAGRPAGPRQVHHSNMWRGPRVDSGEKQHNAQKPVGLMEYLIENSSDDEDIVLDPFLGSGTTMIAAERLGRRCFGMEISERYTQIAIERWQNFTGQKAERV